MAEMQTMATFNQQNYSTCSQATENAHNNIFPGWKEIVYVFFFVFRQITFLSVRSSFSVLCTHVHRILTILQTLTDRETNIKCTFSRTHDIDNCEHTH